MHVAPLVSTPEELLVSANCLAHRISRYNLLTGASNDFLDYPAAVQVYAYETLWRGWHATLVTISDELHAAIASKTGIIHELIALVTKQTRTNKRNVLAQVVMEMFMQVALTR